MATATASPAASRRLRSRTHRLTADGPTPRLDSRPALFIKSSLLRRRFPLVREEALDLLHRVVDLDVERHLAERGSRPAGIAGNAVVLARRRAGIRLPAAAAARARRRHGIAFGCRDQILAHPAFVTAEIQHRG